MYKVFISERALILSQNEGISLPEKSGHMYVTCSAPEELALLIKTIENQPSIKEMTVFCEKPTKLFETLKSIYKIVEAAGGVVKNNKNEILFIFRNGKWDLPKGKLEKGESIEECAVREVAEECGITPPELGDFLKTTYHTYEHKGEKVLKPTHWYAMRSSGNDQLIPQEEEGITEVKWVPKSEFPLILQNTYPNIAELILPL
ncbi:MAG: 8-oxo-dGTP pyrophosphatase MutT (NUDIX family) [Flavobacteriales bacterium]|jgi:8-oxo-dGTP pyrophosphatase MutT (NUDIX family)